MDILRQLGHSGAGWHGKRPVRRDASVMGGVEYRPTNRMRPGCAKRILSAMFFLIMRRRGAKQEAGVSAQGVQNELAR